MTDYPPPPPGNYPPPPPGNYPPPPPPGGYPGPGYGYPAAAPVGTNGLAIAALVLGFVGLLCGVGSIVAVVLGFVAINQIKKTGQQGRGLAIAGIAVGGVTLVINLLVAFSLAGSNTF